MKYPGMNFKGIINFAGITGQSYFNIQKTEYEEFVFIGDLTFPFITLAENNIFLYSPDTVEK